MLFNFQCLVTDPPCLLHKRTETALIISLIESVRLPQVCLNYSQGQLFIDVDFNRNNLLNQCSQSVIIAGSVYWTVANGIRDGHVTSLSESGMERAAMVFVAGIKCLKKNVCLHLI